jgi:hypothetical protein
MGRWRRHAGLGMDAARSSGGLLLCWLVLMAVLWLTRPDELRARELLRLLPDVLRLVSRLSGDRTLPLVDV